MKVAYYPTSIQMLPYQLPLYDLLKGIVITDHYPAFKYLRHIFPELETLQYIEPQLLTVSLIRQGIERLVISDHAPKRFTPLQKRGCKIIQTHHGVSYKTYLTADSYDSYDATLLPGENSYRRIMQSGNTQQLQRLHIVGMPKLDKLFSSASGAEELGLPDKPTILYCPTWNNMGFGLYHSSLNRFVDELLENWPKEWNLIIKPHPNTFDVEPELIAKIRGLALCHDNIRLIDRKSRYCWDAVALYRMADGYIGDVSSTNMEFFATGKPVVLIKLDGHGPEFDEQWQLAAFVDRLQDVPPMLKQVMSSDPWKPKREEKINEYFFKLDGQAAKRAVEVICSI